MGTVLEFAARISQLATGPAMVGLFVALGVVLAARIWLLQVIGLAVVYFAAGLLHAQAVRPEVVLVKWVIGAAVCLALALTPSTPMGRKGGIPSGDAGESVSPFRRLLRALRRLPEDLPLRGVTLLAALLIAYTASSRFPLPQVTFEVGLVCYLMAVVGMFLAGMSEEPLQVGLGLLVFLNGFDLFFSALEPSLVVVGLLGALELLIALAAAHVALSHPQEAR